MNRTEFYAGAHATRLWEWIVTLSLAAVVGLGIAHYMPVTKAKSVPVQRRLDDWHFARPSIDLTELGAEIRAEEFQRLTTEMQRKKLELIDRVITILEKLGAGNGLR